MAWLKGYKYRQEIIADTSKLSGDPEVDIPLTIFGPDLTGKAKSNLDDVVITDTDGTTILKYYWETKSVSAPVGHVKIPSIAMADAALSLGYIYYGYNAADSSESKLSSVFTNSFLARYDLSETTGSTVYNCAPTALIQTGTVVNATRIRQAKLVNVSVLMEMATMYTLEI